MYPGSNNPISTDIIILYYPSWFRCLVSQKCEPNTIIYEKFNLYLKMMVRIWVWKTTVGIYLTSWIRFWFATCVYFRTPNWNNNDCSIKLCALHLFLLLAGYYRCNFLSFRSPDTIMAISCTSILGQWNVDSNSYIEVVVTSLKST